MKKKNSFFRHSKNYLIAELFNKGIVFFTIPIFTRLLLPEEYGILSIFTSIISIFTILIGMNFHGSINRKYQEKDGEFEDYLGTNIVFLLITNIIFLGLGFLLKNQIASFFNIKSDLFFIALIISSLGFYIQIELSYLQGSQQSSEYVKLSVIRNIFLTGSAIVWMYFLRNEKYLGKIYSQLAITIILFVIVIYRLLKISKFNFKKKYIMYSLSFGVPLIPHALSGFILAQFDKIVINQVSGGYETGVYSFAYNIGMIMNVIVSALGNATGPITLNLYREKSYDKLNDLILKTSKIVFIVALILILFSKEIILTLATKEYIEALKIVPVIILSGVMVYMYSIYIFHPFYYKKTLRISLFTIIAGIANIVLNYVFIPKYGYKAAAWTTLGSYILLFLCHYCNTIYFMKKNTFKIKKIIQYLLLLILFVVYYENLRIDRYYIHMIIKLILVLIFGYVIKIREVINEFRK